MLALSLDSLAGSRANFSASYTERLGFRLFLGVLHYLVCRHSPSRNYNFIINAQHLCKTSSEYIVSHDCRVPAAITSPSTAMLRSAPRNQLGP